MQLNFCYAFTLLFLITGVGSGGGAAGAEAPLKLEERGQHPPELWPFEARDASDGRTRVCIRPSHTCIFGAEGVALI